MSGPAPFPDGTCSVGKDYRMLLTAQNKTAQSTFEFPRLNINFRAAAKIMKSLTYLSFKI